MQNELQQLGYSPNQTKVYLALLELGQTTVGPIVKKTDLHRQVVYNTLSELEKMELLQSTIKNNRQNFEIIDPHKIIDNIKKQEFLAEDLLPELMAKQKKKTRTQEVKIYEGIEGFLAMHLNNIKIQPPNTTIYIMAAGGSSWLNLMSSKNTLEKYEKIRVDKNIKTELIRFEPKPEEYWQILKKFPFQDEKTGKKFYKLLPQTYDTPIGIQIWYDRITLLTYTEPILVIEIKNIDFVNNFKSYFNLLWQQDIQAYRGFEAFKNVFYNIIEKDLRPDEEYHVLNANITIESKYKGFIEFFKKYHQDRQKKGVYVKLLFAEKSREFVRKNKNNFNLAEIKYLPPGISAPMQINVYKNKTIMILIEKEPVVFVIENEKIAQSYEQYFQAFWKIGKK
jgi:sugar-specific transcriptional regulator TrmB